MSWKSGIGCCACQKKAVLLRAVEGKGSKMLGKGCEDTLKEVSRHSKKSSDFLAVSAALSTMT